MIRINLDTCSIQEELLHVFQRIGAAETDEERLQAIDRAWYQVFGMSQVFHNAGALGVREEGQELLDFHGLRRQLHNALKRLEDMFDQIADGEMRRNPR